MKKFELSAVEAHEEGPDLRIVSSANDLSKQRPPAPLLLPSWVPLRATRREFVVLGWEARSARLQRQNN